VPNVIHNNDNPTAIKNAMSKIKAQAVKLLAENNRKFPKLCIGDRVKVARRTIGEWRKACTFKKFSYMKIWLYELFKVAEITRPTKIKALLYKLLGPDGKLINRWFLCQDLLKIDPKNLMKELETTETFVVEKVLDKEVLSDGKVKYLVKWYGYGDKDNSWESPQESFQAAIDEYEASHVKQPEPEQSEKSERGTVVPEVNVVAEPVMPKVVKCRGRPPKKPVSNETPKMTLSKQIELAQPLKVQPLQTLDV
jgi:hypothetical protein